jgi:hypothetical protein
MFLRTGKSQIQVTEVRIAVILTHWPPDLWGQLQPRACASGFFLWNQG